MPPRSSRPAPLSLPEGFLLSVLIPVYNERRTLPELLERVRAVELPLEIVVVDDGSTDGTRQWLCSAPGAKYSNVRVLFHPNNRGKGAAIRTALRAATGSHCVFQDADLEYDPSDLPRLLEPLLDGRADAVFGSRFGGFASGAQRAPFFWHSVGNGVLTTFSNGVTNLRLTDMYTCYKMMPTPLLRRLKLRSCGFEIEAEVAVKLSRLRARIFEVPISYDARGYAQGKKIRWVDGATALRAILRYRFFR